MISTFDISNGWTWSPDSRYLLCKWGVLRGVRFLDLMSGRRSEFLQDPDEQVYQPSFCSDGHWIHFWLHRGSLSLHIVDPRLLPSGIGYEWLRRIVMSLTSRAGHRMERGCISHPTPMDSTVSGFKRLDPTVKRPIGVPTPFYHLHSAERSLSNVGKVESDIAVARDRLIFAQSDLTGNVWMIRSGK